MEFDVLFAVRYSTTSSQSELLSNNIFRQSILLSICISTALDAKQRPSVGVIRWDA